jgi:RNA dependent RNA polymerase
MSYEITRIAIDTQTDAIDLFNVFAHNQKFDEPDYGEFCSKLSSVLQKVRKRLPERSSMTAWTNAANGKFQHLGLSGKLEIDRDQTERLLRLKLMPLKVEPPGCRLARKFGCDRLLIINVPRSLFEPRNWPTQLQNSVQQSTGLIVDWFLRQHCFLGRQWVFFGGKQDRGKTTSRTESKSATLRLCFFALDELSPSSPADVSNQNSLTQAKSVGELLEWAIEPKVNKKQQICKLHSRLQLCNAPSLYVTQYLTTIVLSATQATLEFSPPQILRKDNAFSDAPGVWMLEESRSREKKRNPELRKERPEASIMNDVSLEVLEIMQN